MDVENKPAVTEHRCNHSKSMNGFGYQKCCKIEISGDHFYSQNKELNLKQKMYIIFLK